MIGGVKVPADANTIDMTRKKIFGDGKATEPDPKSKSDKQLAEEKLDPLAKYLSKYAEDENTRNKAVIPVLSKMRPAQSSRLWFRSQRPITSRTRRLADGVGRCLHHSWSRHFIRFRGRLMIRSLSALAMAALFGLSASAAEQKFALTGDNTMVEFTGFKKGGKHEGGFKKLTGTASVDGDASTLKLEAEIDTDSLYSDNTKLTAHLKNPDFFGVKDNPKATFKSTKVEKADKGYTITGDLTLLGKTKPVTIPASVEVKDDVLTLKSEFKINRFDWGMTFGKGMVEDAVTLKLNIKAKQ